jgi:hypothetical protein
VLELAAAPVTPPLRDSKIPVEPVGHNSCTSWQATETSGDLGCRHRLATFFLPMVMIHPPVLKRTDWSPLNIAVAVFNRTLPVPHATYDPGLFEIGMMCVLMIAFLANLFARWSPKRASIRQYDWLPSKLAFEMVECNISRDIQAIQRTGVRNTCREPSRRRMAHASCTGFVDPAGPIGVFALQRFGPLRARITSASLRTLSPPAPVAPSACGAAIRNCPGVHRGADRLARHLSR